MVHSKGRAYSSTHWVMTPLSIGLVQQNLAAYIVVSCYATPQYADSVLVVLCLWCRSGSQGKPLTLPRHRGFKAGRSRRTSALGGQWMRGCTSGCCRRAT